MTKGNRLYSVILTEGHRLKHVRADMFRINDDNLHFLIDGDDDDRYDTFAVFAQGQWVSVIEDAPKES